MILVTFIILIVDSVTSGVTATNNVTISDEDVDSFSESHHIGLIRPTKDLSIWIDEDQVFRTLNHVSNTKECSIVFQKAKFFSGIRHLMIHVVANGVVMPYLLDRNLETHLPVIPPEVTEVRFRWRTGHRKYNYNFYRLESHDQDLLYNPTIDIPLKGRIPKKPGGKKMTRQGKYLRSRRHVYYFSILRPSAVYRKLNGDCSFQHRAGDTVQEKKAGRDTFETETEVAGDCICKLFD